MITGGDELFEHHRDIQKFRLTFSVRLIKLLAARAAATNHWTRNLETTNEQLMPLILFGPIHFRCDISTKKHNLCFWFYFGPFAKAGIFHFKLPLWKRGAIYFNFMLSQKFIFGFQCVSKRGLKLSFSWLKQLTGEDKRRRRTVRKPPRYSKFVARIFRPLD